MSVGRDHRIELALVVQVADVKETVLRRRGGKTLERCFVRPELTPEDFADDDEKEAITIRAFNHFQELDQSLVRRESADKPDDRPSGGTSCEFRNKSRHLGSSCRIGHVRNQTKNLVGKEARSPRESAG